MRNLTEGAYRALYVRGILGPDEARVRLLRDGFPQGGLPGFLQQLEAERLRFEAEGAEGTRPPLGPAEWMPDHVWTVAIGVEGAAPAAEALAAEGWDEHDRALWLALAKALTLELVAQRKRYQAERAARSR